jgi:hypothetical protein
MVTKRKILQKILAGSKNIRFSDMINLVEGFGFRLSRTDGSVTGNVKLYQKW